MPTETSLHIEQNQKYRGKDWWDWSVWLEGRDVDLDAVKEVSWRLHPTFTPSVVTTTDRSSRFRLQTSGWGTFELVADIVCHDGSVLRLKHELELFYPDVGDEGPPRRAPT